MPTSKIEFFGPKIISCDGNCKKAWGVCTRPQIQSNEDDPDDFYYIPDGHLGDAPDDPGTYEGGDAKPTSLDQFPNKWCVRACERSFFDDEKKPDFSRRNYNKKHRQDEYDELWKMGKVRR